MKKFFSKLVESFKEDRSEPASVMGDTIIFIVSTMAMDWVWRLLYKGKDSLGMVLLWCASMVFVFLVMLILKYSLKLLFKKSKI